MSSRRTPWWRRILHRVTPFLFKKCPGDNYHWRWDKRCYCRVGEYHADWHGGVYTFPR